MLRGVYDELGLTDEEREQLAREAMEPTMPMPEVEPPPPLAPTQKPTQPATPGPDVELMKARGYDSSGRMARDLKGWGDSFADSVMFSPVGQGYKPVAQPSQRPSAEAQLLGDRAGKAKAAAAAERKAQAELEAKALADYRKMGLERQAAADKASEADRTADNARADKELGWKMDPNNPANRPKAKGAGDSKIRGSNLEGMPYGYELEPGATPSKTQREAAAQVLQQRDDVLPAVQQLRKLVSAGPQRLVSPTAIAEVKQLAQEIATAIRVMENLGVPSGPDTKITLELIGDPNSKLNEMAGVMPKLLDNLDAYFNRKVDTKMRIHGIKKSAGEAKAAEGGGGTVEVVDDEGETLILEASQAERLIKKGAVRAK